VVQGTVSRSRDRLHVTAELVRTADDADLWSRTLDGGPQEIAAVQDSIASGVVGKLHRGAPSVAHGTANDEAYNSFMRGRYASDRLDWPHAIEFFGDAVARDPHFALALGYLAVSYANSPTLGVANVDSMSALALATAKRALALDSTVAQAYVAEAMVLLAEMRVGDAIVPHAKAVALDSTNSDILASYGMLLAQAGRVGDGLPYTRRARELDPLSSTASGLLGYHLELAGQDEEAIGLTKASIRLDSLNVLPLQALGVLYAVAGRPDSAAKYLESAYRVGPALFFRRANLVFADAVAGRWDDAARQRTLMDREVLGNSPNFIRLVADLALGAYDTAMTELDRSVAAREPLAGVLSLSCDPLFNPLKANPRFGALMRRIGATACPPAGRWPIAPRPH
jgi:serine/threonine-protein kinase